MNDYRFLTCSHNGGGPLRPPINAITKNTIKITRNKKNNIFAIPAAAVAIPPKPKTAATNEITKKIKAQCSIAHSLKQCGFPSIIVQLKSFSLLRALARQLAPAPCRYTAMGCFVATLLAIVKLS